MAATASGGLQLRLAGRVIRPLPPGSRLRQVRLVGDVFGDELGHARNDADMRLLCIDEERTRHFVFTGGNGFIGRLDAFNSKRL